MWSPKNLVGTDVLNQHIGPSNSECWLTKAALDELDSGNVLGNSQSSTETRRLSPVHHISQPFPETRKRHAAAYWVCKQLVVYERTLSVKSIDSGPADSRR
jgi:hypothetical protein